MTSRRRCLPCRSGDHGRLPDHHVDPLSDHAGRSGRKMSASNQPPRDVAVQLMKESRDASISRVDEQFRCLWWEAAGPGLMPARAGRIWGSAPGPAQEIKELTPQSRHRRDDQLAAAVEPPRAPQDVGSHRRTPTRFLPRPPPGFTGLPGIPRRHGDTACRHADIVLLHSNLPQADARWPSPKSVAVRKSPCVARSRSPLVAG